MYIFFLILVLDVIALYLISNRIDSSAHFHQMDIFLFGNIYLFIPRLILLMFVLPFTIITNLKYLFKK